MSKQRITYKPQIDYQHDYQSSGKSIEQQDVSISSQTRKEPLDTQSIPSIESNIIYIDSVIGSLPSNLSKALREVYDPIRDIYYDTLIDKIVDPNPQKPEIIFKPKDDGSITPAYKQETIYPIILLPIKFGNEEDKEDDKGETKEEIYPIILESALDEDDVEGEDIRSPHPIILKPADAEDDEDEGPDDEWDEDDDDGLWDEPEIEVEYEEPDIGEAIDKEFIYLMTKLVKHYTDRLIDILNNFYFNSLRYGLGQSEENIKFISNKLEINSNDIMNHSKHLFDSSIKNEDMTTLKTDFFRNIFNVKESVTHIRSFYLSHELRKRYTGIKYSRGKSMANSMSDMALKKANLNYELQYRKTFENLFRYLESSLKVTDDILRLHTEGRSNKSTIIKKGGIR